MGLPLGGWFRRGTRDSMYFPCNFLVMVLKRCDIEILIKQPETAEKYINNTKSKISYHIIGYQRLQGDEYHEADVRKYVWHLHKWYLAFMV